MTWSPVFGTFLALIVLGGLAVSIGYLTVGLKYDDYIPRESDKVEKLIQANIGLQAAAMVLTLIVTRFSPTSLVLPALFLGFSIYMLKLLKG